MNRISLKTLWLIGLAALSVSAFADIVVLTNGEKVEGKVTAETDTEITIAAKVSASITDERVIKKSEIVSITKDAPDELAWQPLKNLKLTRNSLPLPSYDAAINQLKAFATEFPKSKFTADAQKSVDAFEAEKKRIEAGEVKLDDKWLSKEEAQREGTQIKGLIAFNYMKEQGARDMIGALNTLDTIEKNYAGTRAYPDAIEYAAKMLPVLKAEVDRRIKALAEKKAVRAASLAQLTGPDRTALENEIKAEQTAAEAVVSAAEKQGQKWLPLNPPTERGLQNLAAKIPSETQRLAGLPVAKMRASIQDAEKAKALIEKHDVDGASALLSKAAGDWPANELVTRLQKEVDAAKKLAAAKPAAEPVADAPSAATETESATAAAAPAEPVGLQVETEKPFLLTPGGAVLVVIAVGFVVAGLNAFKKVKGKASDVLE